MSILTRCLALVPTLPLAVAWIDHGHMLTAAIAAHYAPDGMEADLANVLGGAEAEFANFTDVPSAAVWFDHIKCSKALVDAHTPWCLGLGKPVGTNQFDSFHFFNWPYMPQQPSAEQEALPVYAGNPVDVLSGALPSLLGQSSSSWAWSFNSRMLLHVMGDLHQPLHVSGYVNKSLFYDQYSDPTGEDFGGNKIKLVGNYTDLGASLHQVWDTAGGAFMKSWPIPRADLDKDVQDLVNSYPAQKFVDAGRLKASWNQPSGCGKDKLKEVMGEAARDTRLLVPKAYAEYLSDPNHGLTYSPSVTYMEFVQETSRSQIALGGYRLSSLLKCIASHIPARQGQTKPQVLMI